MPYGILAFAIVSLLPVVLVLGAIEAQIYWISLAVELRRLLPVVLVLGAIGAQIYWISLAVELRRLLPAPLPSVNRSASPA